MLFKPSKTSLSQPCMEWKSEKPQSGWTAFSQWTDLLTWQIISKHTIIDNDIALYRVEGLKLAPWSHCQSNIVIRKKPPKKVKILPATCTKYELSACEILRGDTGRFQDPSPPALQRIVNVSFIPGSLYHHTLNPSMPWPWASQILAILIYFLLYSFY